MLILSRKIGEGVVINGQTVVRVIRVDGEVVKLGIQAPSGIPIHRLEVYEEIQQSNTEALTENQPALPKLSASDTAFFAATAVSQF
jgi:carbon storage regulator